MDTWTWRAGDLFFLLSLFLSSRFLPSGTIAYMDVKDFTLKIHLNSILDDKEQV